MYSKVYYKYQTIQTVYKGSQNIFTYDSLANMDADALEYIAKVEAADGQPLENSVKIIYNEFFKNCKAFNVWNSIQNCCILAGARTLSGALVPLKGSSPINYNFTDEDYNRGSGLKGDTFTKYLSTDQKESDDVIYRHFVVYVTQPPYKYTLYPSAFIGSEQYQINSDVKLNGMYMKYAAAGAYGSVEIDNFPFKQGVFGINKTGVRDMTCIVPFIQQAVSGSNEFGAHSGFNKSVYVFARNKTTLGLFDYSNVPVQLTDARIGFYSIGNPLNLNDFKACINNLMISLSSLFYYEPWIYPPPTSATFVSYSIPLNITSTDGNYNIDQIGTNNPSMTCYRGTNYDFIINTASHPFALRNNLEDVSTQISGTYNNDTQNGVSNGTIWFTPNDNTPNIIYYQCTIHSNTNGTIYIKNY